MPATLKKENSIFFNHSFDKKRLKALISWVFKKSGEAEALKVLDLLKETGFRHATKAGISIGLHDLRTPIQKSWLISESQLAMNTTDTDFVGAKITATERSQRIIDTWHRASESLSKQVVDYFGIYDQFNPVYIMALSGARGNFSQVRQLIGMRGLMADQQGKIVNFPIRSNLREGLTLTEYFISCSGARKGLVDTALRTADTGYLTRRLVDVSHHVVVKRSRCNSNRGIAFTSLQSYSKILLPLKERLVGRVLAEDVEMPFPLLSGQEGNGKNAFRAQSKLAGHQEIGWRGLSLSRKEIDPQKGNTSSFDSRVTNGHTNLTPSLIAKKDQEISPKISLKISQVREKVFIRSPLTCGFTHSVCQLCYGWSISQGSLVSLGDAVGVIAAQSIGEPGTQLTMRTFHTGGVFSGDLLQEIRAPHAGIIQFSKAFQGLLIRSAHGRIAFLSKTEGALTLSNVRNSQVLPLSRAQTTLQNTALSAKHATPSRGYRGTTGEKNTWFTEIPIQAFTMLFVRQGEKVEKNQLLAEFSIQSKEGNQPIKTQQTIFAELSGRVIEDRSGKIFTKPIKESCVSLSSSYPVSSPLGTKIEGLHAEVADQRNQSCACCANPRIPLALRGKAIANPRLCNSSISPFRPVPQSGAERNGEIFQRFALNPFALPCKSSVLCFALQIEDLQSKAKQSKARTCTCKVKGHHKNARNSAKSCSYRRARVPKAMATPMPFKSKVFKNSRAGISKKIGKRLTLLFERLKFVRDLVTDTDKDRREGFARLAFSTKELRDLPSSRKALCFSCNQFSKPFICSSKSSRQPFTHVYRPLQCCALCTNPLLTPVGGCANLLCFALLCKSSICKAKQSKAKQSKAKGLRARRTAIGAKICICKRICAARTRFAIALHTGSRAKRKQAVTLLYKATPTSYAYSTARKGTKGAKRDKPNLDLQNRANGIRKTICTGSRACLENQICKSQIASRLKSEDLENDVFKYIEPFKSGRLGFLKILATRVGATLDYTCPIKPFDYHFIKRRRREGVKMEGNGTVNHSLPDFFSAQGAKAEASKNLATERLERSVNYLHPEHIKENRFFLQTIAKYGDIVDEAYKTKMV